MTHPGDHLLLVDGECGVCCLTGLWVERRVPGVRAIAIESSAGRRALAGMDADLRRGSWHLCAAGDCRSGAAVVGALLTLTGHRRLAVAAGRLEPFSERLYRLAVRSRGVWARAFPRARRDAARLTIARREA